MMWLKSSYFEGVVLIARVVCGIVTDFSLEGGPAGWVDQGPTRSYYTLSSEHLYDEPQEVLYCKVLGARAVE
jgi:hypothetical protein